MNKEYFGYININPVLNYKELNYLSNFSNTRRMDRKKGPYFIEGANQHFHIQNQDVIDYNKPPRCQPGLWCKWVPTDDGKYLKWNGYRKFYNPKEWLNYLIAHFLGDEPVAKLVHPEEYGFFQGHKLNGIIKDNKENKFIIVKNNKIIESINENNKNKVHNDLIQDISLAIKQKEEFTTIYEDKLVTLYFNKKQKVSYIIE